MKYMILIHAGKLSTEEIGKKLCEELGITEIPSPDHGICGIRDGEGKLDFSFLDVKDGEMKIIITDSDNLVRQINLAILRESLEKAGKEIPENCKDIKGIDYNEVEAYWIGLDGKVEKLKVSETGTNAPVVDTWIEEVNKMMEDMYYGLKYS